MSVAPRIKPRVAGVLPQGTRLRIANERKARGILSRALGSLCVELHRVDFGHSQRRSASKEPFAQLGGCGGFFFWFFFFGRKDAVFPRRFYIKGRHVGVGFNVLSSFPIFLPHFACGFPPLTKLGFCEMD